MTNTAHPMNRTVSHTAGRCTTRHVKQFLIYSCNFITAVILITVSCNISILLHFSILVHHNFCYSILHNVHDSSWQQGGSMLLLSPSRTLSSFTALMLFAGRQEGHWACSVKVLPEQLPNVYFRRLANLE